MDYSNPGVSNKDFKITLNNMIKKIEDGNTLAVQWLGLCASLPRAQVQSLVRELGFHKPSDVAIN